jgi:hypothetical protein
VHQPAIEYDEVGRFRYYFLRCAMCHVPWIEMLGDVAGVRFNTRILGLGPDDEQER